MKVDEAIASIETGKAAVDIKSPVDGKIVKFLAEVGATVLVGNDFAVIDETAAPPAETKPAEKPEQKAEEPKQKAEEKPAEPVKETPKPKEEAKPKPAPKVERRPVMDVPSKGSRETRRVPMSQLREHAAMRLKESQNTYAMLTTFNECDMTAISSIRRELGSDFLKKYGVDFTFVSAFVKAATMSLQGYPAINAVIDGREIVYHDYVDIGVEVGAPSGILVPVLRNCESMSFNDIEKVY